MNKRIDAVFDILLVELKITMLFDGLASVNVFLGDSFAETLRGSKDLLETALDLIGIEKETEESGDIRDIYYQAWIDKYSDFRDLNKIKTYDELEGFINEYIMFIVNYGKTEMNVEFFNCDKIKN
tara:strand:- start:882 stop:1256 length:375 start_codon:yes stop_codon:yes gene_type:complete